MILRIKDAGPRSLGPTYIALALCLLVSSCASQAQKSEAELAQLLDWYPGHYTAPEAKRDLNIVRVYAPSLGDFAYYQQDTVSDDPQRIITQRVVTFQVVKGQGIVESLWSPAEPARWRDAHLSPDLFKGLQPQDFAPMRGCALVWRKDGERFVGANDAKVCRSTSPDTGGTLKMDLRAQLTPDELTLTDLSYDVAGKLVQGNEAAPAYHFRRR